MVRFGPNVPQIHVRDDALCGVSAIHELSHLLTDDGPIPHGHSTDWRRIHRALMAHWLNPEIADEWDRAFDAMIIAYQDIVGPPGAP